MQVNVFVTDKGQATSLAGSTALSPAAAAIPSKHRHGWNYHDGKWTRPSQVDREPQSGFAKTGVGRQACPGLLNSANGKSILGQRVEQVVLTDHMAATDHHQRLHVLRQQS